MRGRAWRGLACSWSHLQCWHLGARDIDFPSQESSHRLAQLSDLLGGRSWRLTRGTTFRVPLPSPSPGRRWRGLAGNRGPRGQQLIPKSMLSEK